MFDILHNRDFALLWLAGLISYIADRALIIALPLHVYRQTDSTLATAGAFAAALLPRVLIGSVAGVFVDRWDRKRIMIASDILRMVIPLPILLMPDSIGLLFAISAVRGTVGVFFQPAESALLPTIVGQDRLVAANAMNALNDNLGLLIGPAVGATLYASVGLPGVALFTAGLFIVPVLLLSLISTPARPIHKDDGLLDATPVKRVLTDWVNGLGVVRGDRSLRILFVSGSLGGIAEGVFMALGLAPLILDVLGGTSAQVGWFATAQAVGGLMAGMIIVRIGHRFTKRWLIGGGLAGLGLADLTAFNAFRVAATGTPSVSVAMGSMALAGFPSVAGVAGTQSLIQTQASDAFRGRVFGAFTAAQGVAMLIGLGIGGVLGDAIGLVPVLSVSALVRVLGGVIALVFLPRQETSLADRPSSELPGVTATNTGSAEAPERGS